MATLINAKRSGQWLLPAGGKPTLRPTPPWAPDADGTIRGGDGVAKGAMVGLPHNQGSAAFHASSGGGVSGEDGMLYNPAGVPQNAYGGDKMLVGGSMRCSPAGVTWNAYRAKLRIGFPTAVGRSP